MLKFRKKTIFSLCMFLAMCGLAYAASPKASQIITDTSNFDNNLSSEDDTVQKALETLNDIVGSSPGSVVVETVSDTDTIQMVLAGSDLSANLIGDTDDLTEGSNLYYTQDRFDSAFSNKTTADLTEGAVNFYDKIVTLTNNDDNIDISGTYPDFDIDLADNISASTINLDINYTELGTELEGTIYFNIDEHTYNLVLQNGTILQLGQELLTWVKNANGDLGNGAVVYISGSSGNTPTINVADADLLEDGAIIAVITTQGGINTNNNGYITFFGHVRDIDTDYFSSVADEGKEVYLSSTAGQMTLEEPETGFPFIIGKLIRSSATVGQVYIYPRTHLVHYENDMLEMKRDLSLEDSLSVFGDLFVNNNTLIEGEISANSYNGIEDSMVEVNSVSGASYDSSEDWFNSVQSAGIISGGSITDSGSGQIDVSELQCIFKTSASFVGENIFGYLSAQSNVSLSDNNVNYISVDYNGGTPQLIVGTSNTANGTTIFNLGKVYREGTSVDIIDAGLHIQDFSRRVQKHHMDDIELEFTSGANVSETGTRNIAISAGVMYAGLNRIVTDAIDTSVADTFEYYYYTGAAWTESDATQINNTQYNNIASGLATLNNNQYGVHWVYKGTNSTTYVVYGQGSYTLVEAQAIQPPNTLPPHVSGFGVLRAKIIIEKSGTVFTEIASVDDISFVKGAAGNHNELSGLQGGEADNYYHLTSAQHSDVVNISDNRQLTGSLELSEDLTARYAYLDGLAFTSQVSFSNILDIDMDGDLSVDEVNARILNGDGSAITGLTASNISDFDIEVANNSAVALNTAKVTNATHTGDVSGATTLTIGNDKILESMLKAVNSPTDEYALTYESTTGDFEWQTFLTTESDPVFSAMDTLAELDTQIGLTGTADGTTYLRGDGSWTTPSGASPLTTKGDLYTYSTSDTRLPVGTDNYILSADSAEATGLKWIANTGGGLTNLIDTTDGNNALYDLSVSGDLTVLGNSSVAGTSTVEKVEVTGDTMTFTENLYFGYQPAEDIGLDLSIDNMITISGTDYVEINNLSVGNVLSFSDGTSMTTAAVGGSSDFNDSSYLDGLTIAYASTSSVTIGAGRLVVVDAVVDVAYTAHTITNFSSGGYTYLYVNGSGTISDSTTAPTSSTYDTWYNGSNRCIGALYCDAASEIQSFISINEGNVLTIFSDTYNSGISLVSNGNPSSAWVSTTVDNTSKTPVNAIACLLRAYNVDSGSICTVGIRSEQNQNSVAFNTGTGPKYVITWIDFVYPFDIQWYGDDDDDNTFYVNSLGYKIKR